MVYAAEHDPLCYPGTTVLINLLDLRDAALLEEVELALFLTRADEPFPAGNLDAAHYLSLHRHLFQDVYAWAGRIRTIRIGKGGNWFCYPGHIPNYLDRTFKDLGDPDTLRHLSPSEFAVRIGRFLAELNAVHPFREGNGRTQLAFAAMLADHAGLPFDTGKLEPSRVLDAMIESFAGDAGAIVALVEELIS